MTKKKILTLINEVLDPELQIGLVDLGLIYDILQKKGGALVVKMTLTQIGCPLGPYMAGEIEDKLKKKGFKKVLVNMVWNPPWTPDRMKPEIRKMMFGE